MASTTVALTLVNTSSKAWLWSMPASSFVLKRYHLNSSTLNCSFRLQKVTLGGWVPFGSNLLTPMPGGLVATAACTTSGLAMAKHVRRPLATWLHGGALLTLLAMYSQLYVLALCMICKSSRLLFGRKQQHQAWLGFECLTCSVDSSSCEKLYLLICWDF